MGVEATKAAREAREAPAESLRARWGPALGALWPDVATGLRAAVSTVVPFALAAHYHRPALGWMALGGWWGTLVDPGGARARRAAVLGAFALMGAAVVAVAQQSARAPWLATVVVGATVFVVSLLRALGAVTSTLGTMLSFAAAVAVASQGARAGTTATEVGYFVAGVGSALLLSSIVWPVWTHVPVRRALAKVFTELADYARALEAARSSASAAESVDEARWSALARKHPRRVRDALEKAREVALSVRARRPGETLVGSNLRVLLGTAESEFLLLVTVAESVEREASRGRAGATGEGSRLLGLAERFDDTHDALVVPTARAGAGLRPSSARAEGETSALARLERAASASLDAARSLRTEAARTGAAHAHAHEVSLLAASEAEPEGAWAALRDALSLGSPVFLHALRAGLAVAVAVRVGAWISPPHVTWVTVTTVAVLQPYAGATIERAVERGMGTVLGALVAVAVALTFRTPVALALAMVPLLVAASVTRPRSYRLFTLFMTPVFVLIAVRHPSDWWTAAARVGDTLVGGLIALAAALTFPSREQSARLPDALAVMRAAVGAYATAVVGELGAPTSASRSAELVALRRSVGVAISDAETSLERLLAEPRHDLVEAGRAMLRVTFARRLSLATTALYAHAAGASRATPLHITPERLAGYVQAHARGGVAAGESLRASVVAPGADVLTREALDRVLRFSELLGQD